jgi:hypothetical protein
MVLLLLLRDFCSAGVVSSVLLLLYTVMVMCVLGVALIWHRALGDALSGRCWGLGNLMMLMYSFPQ